jgi:hypothetical protein
LLTIRVCDAVASQSVVCVCKLFLSFVDLE